MSKFNALDYDCPACPAKVDQWCAPNWPYDVKGLIGFTHEQRTTYNLLANQPADGEEATKAQWDDAVEKWNGV